MAPFNEFPAEILGLIFLQGTISQRVVAPYGIPFPFTVSKVCKLWRSIALGTPELWTLVVVPSFYQPSASHSMDVTDKLIKLSGALPISVFLDARFTTTEVIEHSGEPAAMDFMRDMLQFILKAAGHRLQRLELCVPFGFRLHALPELEKGVNLQELTVISALNLSTLFVQAPFDNVPAMPFPRLRRLRWAGSSIPKHSNLTHFSVRSFSVSYADVCAFFESSPCLSHLVLDDTRAVGIVPQPIPPRISVPSLTHIAIRMYRSPFHGNEKHIFAYLDLPQLSYLELNNTISLTQLFGADAIPRIAGSLRTLIIANCLDAELRDNPHKEQDLAAIRAFHRLEHLHLFDAPSQLLKPIASSDLSGDQTLDAPQRSSSISRLRSALLPEARAHPILAVYRHHRGPLDTGALSSVQRGAGSRSALWPCLQHITFHSLSASDVANLCQLVVAHPMVAALDLSVEAIRHLRTSIVRKGDLLDLVPWKPWTSLRPGGDEGVRDAEEWVSARVKLRVMKEKVKGMLYNREASELGFDLP